MENVQVFSIKIFLNGYEQLIYTTADNIRIKRLCTFDELDEAEQKLFGNTDLGDDFAVFEPESIS
jgi:hypothetical protein